MCPPRYRGGGGLLHRLSTLTGLGPAVYFCCTGLEVTLTGRYPASCPAEARTFLTCGLSTLAAAIIRQTCDDDCSISGEFCKPSGNIFDCLIDVSQERGILRKNGCAVILTCKTVSENLRFLIYIVAENTDIDRHDINCFILQRLEHC